MGIWSLKSIRQRGCFLKLTLLQGLKMYMHEHLHSLKIMPCFPVGFIKGNKPKKNGKSSKGKIVF